MSRDIKSAGEGIPASLMVDPRISVSVYLIKVSAVADVEKLLRGANAIPLTNGFDGSFAHFPAPSKTPTWYQAVQAYLPTLTELDIRAQSAAGIMLLSQKPHVFAITFGHAWQYLDLPWLVSDFGRRVALELILPAEMLELNFEQVFAKFHSSKERAPRATSFREFGVEAERDLVGAVEGLSPDPVFGKVIRGGTSLRMTILFRTIPAMLKKAATLFAKNTYAKNYPTIDNLTHVADDGLISTLDKLLDADLCSGSAKARVAMVSPSFRSGDKTSADAFAYGRRMDNQATSPYLQYGSWEHHLLKTKQTPTLALAKGTKVHMFDRSGEVFETRSVYECLGYEISHGGAPYILSSGTWWSANVNFVAEIDRSLNAIGPYPGSLPAWDQKVDEGEYNKLCCKGTGRLLFDEKLVWVGGGQSKFEFCDFMDPKQKVLFFAKITGKSSGSSHLVEQVKRTVELLFSPSDAFRKKLKGVFAKHHSKASTAWLNQRPKPGEWTICLVSLGRKKEKLPLFAKCSVVRLCKTLDMAGHPVIFESV